MLKLVDILMRGEIAYKILDFLEDRGMATVDFFTGFLAAGYGASMGKMEYQHRMRNRARHSYQIDREKKRNLQKYIYKLKSQGFLSENFEGRIVLSGAGKKKLSLLRKNKILDRKQYRKEVSDKVTIISYDLPVAFNKERNILRDLLRLLGFKLIHKSVWVGKVKLPKQFILALEKLGIIKFVEILEVTKSGSLNKI